jgi:hypothetical protein
MQIPMAKNILAEEMNTGKLSALVRIWVSKKTSVNPINPPMMHKKEDYKRNSVKII